MVVAVVAVGHDEHAGRGGGQQEQQQSSGAQRGVSRPTNNMAEAGWFVQTSRLKMTNGEQKRFVIKAKRMRRFNINY